MQMPLGKSRKEWEEWGLYRRLVIERGGFRKGF